MENIVDMRVSWEVKLVGHRIDFLQNGIGSQTFEVKFVRGASGFDMSSKEPDMVTNVILGGLQNLPVIETSMVLLS
jgi:hypothetical protein